MIPVTRLDDGAVSYIECGHCGTVDVTYERADWVDPNAGPSDRHRYLTEIVTCHAGQGCPEQKLDPLWSAAARRHPPLHDTAPTPVSVVSARRKHPITGRRQQVLVALLRGAQDGHEIGEVVGCDHNQVATRAKELETAGYVQRVGKRQGPRTAKVTVYALTVDGRQLATQYANDQQRNAA